MRWRTCGVSKHMYSFMFLLIQTKSETSFKNNQYRWAAQHNNAYKLVYVTGIPSLSKHWLFIVWSWGEPVVTQGNWKALWWIRAAMFPYCVDIWNIWAPYITVNLKKCMKILLYSLEKGNVLRETQTYNISANIYWMWALTVING